MKNRHAAIRKAFAPAILLLFSLLQGKEIVILPQDDPLLSSPTVTRAQLARALISYCPVGLLQKLSRGRKIPASNAPEEEVWSFLNGTDILPPMSDGLNYPEDPVSRSHMAILLQRIAMMLSPGSSPTPGFQVPVDIDPARYDAHPILEVLSYGLMHSDSAGRFAPDSPISGEDAIGAILSLKKFSKGHRID